MKGVITAPKDVITGAFTLRFAFWREIALTMADIQVETLEGDALGHKKDCLAGSGQNYYILCYLPEGRKGKSRISVGKDGFEVPPVVVEYDTIRTVRATYGTPIKQNGKIEIPVSFDAPIQHLKKRNFRLSVPAPFQLYRVSRDAYSVVLPERSSPFRITVSGTVRKQNGNLRASIIETRLQLSSEV